MMMRALRFTLLAAPVLLLALAAGCTTDTVFVDRPPFNPPPDSAAGFLGYFDVAQKTTTCGNCHVSRAASWQGTAHADAYNTLANNPGAQPFCFTCHTVSENGNLTPGPAGWNVVQSDAYHDVQCESCHGPGFQHVQAPDASAPRASIKGDTTSTAACGSCHSGAHNPFIEDWSQSRHNIMNPFPRSREECISCHTAQGALKAFGVNSRYLEWQAPLGQMETITCAVCHDPHGSDNPAQLRFALTPASQETNLCIKCHHKRSEPDTGVVEFFRGPHSPEGPLVLGEVVGWIPPGTDPEIGRIRGSHGADRNQRLCAQCHVEKFSVTDAQTGNFIVTSTGHTFRAIPCVDANGQPTPDQSCTQLTERRFVACTASGCHADETAARSAYTVATNRIDPLIATLDSLLQRVPPGELDPTTGIFTVAKGASFNKALAEKTGSSVHNPFLIEQLLTASISAVNAEYGPFTIRINLDLQL